MIDYEARLPKLMTSAAEALGVEPDLEHAQIRNYNPGNPNSKRYITCQDTTGNLQLAVEEHGFTQNVQPFGSGGNTDAMFSFNNNLFFEEGPHKVANIPADFEGFEDYRDEPPYVVANAICTPQAVNNFQKTIGKQPGVDAFEIVVEPGASYFHRGAWIYSFAEMKRTVSDPRYWSHFQHDMEPFGHMQGWILTPPQLCKAIGNKAAELIEVHGPVTLAEPYGTRPAEIRQFMEAADVLEKYTSRLYEMLYNAPPSLNDVEAKRFVISVLARSANALTNHNTILADYIARRQAHEIGFIKHIGDFRDFRKVELQFMSFMGGLLITLEDINPREDTEKATQQVETWHNIGKYIAEIQA